MAARAWPVIGLLAACGGAPGATLDPTLPIRDTPLQPAVQLRFNEDGFGPINADTVLDLGALATLLRGYELRPETGSAAPAHADIEIRREGVVIALIIRDSRDPRVVYNVHGFSRDIIGPSPSWHVGAALADLDGIDRCECWGDQPTCYASGSRLAVMIDTTACEEPITPADLAGHHVARVIWSRIELPTSEHDDQNAEPEFGE